MRKLALGLVVLAICLPFRAFADESAPAPQPTPEQGGALSDFTIDEKDPEKSVPTDAEGNKNPIQFGYFLMDLAEKAGRATRKGDHLAAARFWAATAKAVPERSVGFSKACTSYEAAGEWSKAVEACRTALGRDGVTVADSVHFVRLMLDKTSALEPSEKDDVDAVIEQLKKGDATVGEMAAQLNCEVGVRLEDVGRLEECTTFLNAKTPDDPKTISYAWMLALKKKDYAGARRLVERAKNTAMAPEGIAKMELATQSAEPMWRKALRDWRVLMVLGISVASFFILRNLARRRAPLRVSS